MRPDLFVGTSAGAINAVGFASLMHLGAARSSSAVLDLWREVHASSVFRGPLRTALGKLPGRGYDPGHARGLLDTAPLAGTLDRIVDWDRLHANIRDDGVGAVGVVATSSSARHSTVFFEAAGRVPFPSADRDRAIVYVPTVLDVRHVLASSAIPVLFPAVEIERPQAAAGWYFDGGVRLNTPIKPALAMGAQRVVVVATAPLEAHEPHRKQLPAPAPGICAAAARILHAMLDDRMVEDLQTLARKNESGVSDQVVPWLFGGPCGDDAGLLGRLVTEVLDGGAGRGRRRGPLSKLTRQALGRALAGDPSRSELASYLYFDADFIEGSIRLGRRDAEMSLGPGRAPVWHEARVTGATSG
jgi:NTE family protein